MTLIKAHLQCTTTGPAVRSCGWASNVRWRKRNISEVVFGTPWSGHALYWNWKIFRGSWKSTTADYSSALSQTFHDVTTTQIWFCCSLNLSRTETKSILIIIGSWNESQDWREKKKFVCNDQHNYFTNWIWAIKIFKVLKNVFHCKLKLKS